MRTSTAETLRVLLEPDRDGAHHMARDAELLRTHEPSTGPVLRLYSWNPPCVSLGHMQRAEELLDLEACRAAGVDVVRRPTGGRAILHAQEITYAVVAANADPRFGTDLAGSHAAVARCLAAGLERLGVQAHLSRPALDPERRLLRQPCFVSPGRAELLVRGRKLLGSAQRRSAHAFLQHGSLLVGPGHERLIDLLLDAGRDRELAVAMRARLRRDTVTLRELLGREPPFAELARALTDGFCATLDLDPASG